MRIGPGHAALGVGQVQLEEVGPGIVRQGRHASLVVAAEKRGEGVWPREGVTQRLGNFQRCDHVAKNALLMRATGPMYSLAHKLINEAPLQLLGALHFMPTRRLNGSTVKVLHTSHLALQNYYYSPCSTAL